MDYKILQMLPGAGWFATYHGEDALLDPLVCLALIEDPSGQFIVPMISVEDQIVRADKSSKYAGLMHESEI